MRVNPPVDVLGRGSSLVGGSSLVAYDVRSEPHQTSPYASIILTVRHQGWPPLGSLSPCSASRRSAAGSSPSTALLSMAPWAAAEPPLPPPTGATASPVRWTPLSTAPRWLSPAKSRRLLPWARRGRPSSLTWGTPPKVSRWGRSLEVDGTLWTELFPGLMDVGLRHLLPRIPDMPNSVTNGKLLPMTPHHVFLEFHLSLRGSFPGLLKFAQRHITIQAKGTPHLLKVMCLEHSDNTLTHWLQWRGGVRRKKDELYITMQVLQHMELGGSVFEDCQDMEVEAVFLQLVHQLYLAVLLKNVTRHPTTGIGAPMDNKLFFIVPLECMRVFSVVDHDRLKFAVSHQVSPQQEGEMALECFEASGRLLSLDVRAFRHLLPL